MEELVHKCNVVFAKSVTNTASVNKSTVCLCVCVASSPSPPSPPIFQLIQVILHKRRLCIGLLVPAWSVLRLI
jgi:hypothetical protein